MDSPPSTSPLARATPDSVRLPPDLREYIRQQAAANHRSFSGEVCYRLEETRRQEMLAAGA